jgi:hypothetical protein
LAEEAEKHGEFTTSSLFHMEAMAKVILPSTSSIKSFDHLRIRSKKLPRDAHEAGAGALPAGY